MEIVLTFADILVLVAVKGTVSAQTLEHLLRAFLGGLGGV